VKSILIIFFDIKGFIPKEFVLAGQRVNFAYYCAVLRRLRENLRRLRFELRRQKDNAPSHTSFFAREFLTKNNMITIPIHLTFLFSRLKIKLECSHLHTSEVIETESQTVLNILPEHDLKNAFKKKGSSAWNGLYTRKGTTSKVTVASRPKVSFWWDGSTSLGNYGWLFAFVFAVLENCFR
jgi:hypothetical protein